VRVSGEPGANGFAIEIEDRGLGMTPERQAELNDRLMNPPDVNPANTDQLGLFVVAQLARRHGIRVMLRSSPYGGTSAIVLIPPQLVVDDAPAALTSGENPMLTTRSPAPAQPSFSSSETGGGNGAGRANGYPSENGYPSGQPGGAAQGGTGPYSASPYNSASPYSASQASQHGASQYSASPYSASQASQHSASQHGASQYGASPYSASQASQHGASQYGDGSRGTGASSPPDLDTIQLSGGFMSGTRGPGGYPRVSPPGAAGQPAPAGNGSQRQWNSDDIPVVTGIPVSRDAAPPFDVFTPVSRSGNGYDPGAEDPEPGIASYQGAPYGNIEGNDEVSESRDVDGGEHQGLPRRVRQASLAPQLRKSSAGGSDAGGSGAGGSGAGGSGPAGVPPASAASLSDMRSTLSAMQRGWQQGRSQSGKPDTEGNPYGT
jgi:hypothetical protein